MTSNNSNKFLNTAKLEYVKNNADINDPVDVLEKHLIFRAIEWEKYMNVSEEKTHTIVDLNSKSSNRTVLGIDSDSDNLISLWCADFNDVVFEIIYEEDDNTDSIATTVNLAQDPQNFEFNFKEGVNSDENTVLASHILHLIRMHLKCKKHNRNNIISKNFKIIYDPINDSYERKRNEYVSTHADISNYKDIVEKSIYYKLMTFKDNLTNTTKPFVLLEYDPEDEAFNKKCIDIKYMNSKSVNVFYFNYSASHLSAIIGSKENVTDFKSGIDFESNTISIYHLYNFIKKHAEEFGYEVDDKLKRISYSGHLYQDKAVKDALDNENVSDAEYKEYIIKRYEYIKDKANTADIIDVLKHSIIFLYIIATDIIKETMKNNTCDSYLLFSFDKKLSYFSMIFRGTSYTLAICESDNSISKDFKDAVILDNCPNKYIIPYNQLTNMIIENSIEIPGYKIITSYDCETSKIMVSYLKKSENEDVKEFLLNKLRKLTIEIMKDNTKSDEFILYHHYGDDVTFMNEKNKSIRVKIGDVIQILYWKELDESKLCDIDKGHLNLITVFKFIKENIKQIDGLFPMVDIKQKKIWFELLKSDTDEVDEVLEVLNTFQPEPIDFEESSFSEIHENRWNNLLRKEAWPTINNSNDNHYYPSDS